MAISSLISRVPDSIHVNRQIKALVIAAMKVSVYSLCEAKRWVMAQTAMR